MDVALDGFYWFLFTGALLLASVLDLYRRRVPNWLTVALALTGLVGRLLHGGFLASAWGAAGLLLGVALLIVPFARGWLGGGDVKLLGAVGVWFGPRLLLEAALVTALVGGVFALVYLLRAPRAERRDMVRNLKLSAISMSIVAGEGRSHALSPPYAPAIAAGALWVLWSHAA